MSRQLIRKLNLLRAFEQRMSAAYRRAAEVVTGPSREALAAHLREHAEDEDRHAEIVMRHTIAIGGDLETDIGNLPIWRTTDEVINGLMKLEREGMKLWQDLLNSLDKNDAFRHTVESILETEQEHLDDTILFRSGDTTEKSMSYNGSKKPLNWRDPDFVEHARKSQTWDEKIDQHHRAGTPITVRGAYNGAPSGLQQKVPSELNPALTLKAVLAPVKVKPDGSKDIARKRGPDGKFAPAQDAGQQSTAEDDAKHAQREESLAHARIREKLRPDYAPPKPGHMVPRKLTKDAKVTKATPGVGMNPLPGASSADAVMSDGSDAATPLGNLPSGKPLFDDPYHQSHDGFSPDDHSAAAGVHEQAAAAAAAQGDSDGAASHKQKAQVHSSIAQDGQSPMQRFAPAGGVAKANPFDALNQFLAQRTVNSLGSPGTSGPAPGMVNTQTGGPVGPQTAQTGFAGTVPQPAPVPPPPASGSMPEIGSNQGTVAGTALLQNSTAQAPALDTQAPGVSPPPAPSPPGGIAPPPPVDAAPGGAAPPPGGAAPPVGGPGAGVGQPDSYEKLMGMQAGDSDDDPMDAAGSPLDASFGDPSGAAQPDDGTEATPPDGSPAGDVDPGNGDQAPPFGGDEKEAKADEETDAPSEGPPKKPDAFKSLNDWLRRR